MIRNLFWIFITGIGISMLFKGCCNLEQSREALSWPQTKGSVVSSSLTVDHLPKYIDPRDDPARWYGTAVQYEYSVNGEGYTSDTLSFRSGGTLNAKDALNVLNKYRHESEVPVYYNPKNPRESVLQPGYIGDVFLQFLLGILLTFLGVLYIYPRTLEYNPEVVDLIARGNTLQNRWKYDEALSEYNQFIRINPYLALGYISRGNLFLQQKGAFQKFKFFEPGSTVLNELAKSGILEDFPSRELPLGFYEFRVDEFGGSLEKIKPLLLKIGGPKDGFKDITAAVNWLNRCIEPYKIYAIYIKANGISEGMRLMLPGSFLALSQDQLSELSLTIKGRELKRAILDHLFPRETPGRLRINPFNNFNEEDVRKIAKDEFDRIWNILLLSQETWDRAIADFKQAITIEPKNSFVYYSLGKAYSGKNQFDKAWECMNKAREMGFDVNPGVLEDLKRGIIRK